MKLKLLKDDNGFSRSIRSGHQYEGFESSWFANFIKPGDCVLDVGANIGFYSIIASKMVGKNGRVYSLEPDFKNYEILMENLILNEASNVTPFCVAASNENGIVPFFRNKDNAGKHQVWPLVQGEKTEQETEVIAIKVDSLLPNVNFDVIKIDTEGWEWAVLQGMKSFLSRTQRCVMLMEYWPAGIRQSGGNAESMFSDLRENGFFFFLMNRAEGIVQSVENVQNLIADKGNNLCYILCIKRPKF